MSRLNYIYFFIYKLIIFILPILIKVFICQFLTILFFFLSKIIYKNNLYKIYIYYLVLIKFLKRVSTIRYTLKQKYHTFNIASTTRSKFFSILHSLFTLSWVPESNNLFSNPVILGISGLVVGGALLVGVFKYWGFKPFQPSMRNDEVPSMETFWANLYSGKYLNPSKPTIVSTDTDQMRIQQDCLDLSEFSEYVTSCSKMIH